MLQVVQFAEGQVQRGHDLNIQQVPDKISALRMYHSSCSSDTQNMKRATVYCLEKHSVWLVLERIDSVNAAIKLLLMRPTMNVFPYFEAVK